ncbi:hypothetical protein GCM10023164_00910 [Christiangramia aestuarii]
MHLLIHLLGFAISKEWITGPESLNISSEQGILWLIVSTLLLIIIFLFILRKPAWIILGIPMLITSQVLIILNWNEAATGSIVNFVIFLVVIFSIFSWNFENSFKKDKIAAIRENPGKQRLISRKDIEHLPGIVQKYLHYSGFVGRPRIENVQIRFKGEMREKGKSWFNFRAEQLNTVRKPARYFFMKAIFKGIPTKGYHRYDGHTASMNIKPFSLFSIVKIQTEELLVSDMVTYLNDICLFAPGALIEDHFTWQEMGENTARVIFTYNTRSVSAVLEIDDSGQLINFFSNDRYDINKNQKFMFSTPVAEYTNFGDYKLAGYGEAIWHYFEEDFMYGKFYVKKVKFNISAQD